MGTYGKRSGMIKSKQNCPTCKESLYVTRLQEKYFCRKCWEYKEVK